MQILLAGSVSPFTGREELHWLHAISRNIRDLGFQIDTFMLPVVQNPLLLPEQMMALRLLDLEASCDLLLTIGYPAFVLKHPRKRALLFALAPHLHEWFDSEYGVLATNQYQIIRDAVRNTEKKCLSEAERIICASGMLADQIKNDYSLDSRAMNLDDASVDDSTVLFPGEGVWVITESTLEPHERVEILLDAIAFSEESWKLNIFVPSASDVYHNALLHRIERLRINERVFVTMGSLPISVLEKSCCYVSLHYLTTRIPECVLRAAKVNAPIITSSDCGALLQVVEHNVNGLVVAPDSKSIARALDQITVNKELAQQLSQGNKDFISSIADVYTVTQRLIQ